MKNTLLLLLLLGIIHPKINQQSMASTSSANDNQPLAFESVYPIFITKNLMECKAFYTHWFEMDIIFEASWFILLATKGDKPFTVAFMDENHPSSPPSSPAMSATSGICLTLQVADAEMVYIRLLQKGITILYPLKKEDWGQLRFGVTDPNGMYVDIVQQVEPKAGYWEKYLPTGN